jgi:DNA-binding response OmpR family regulator
MRVLLIEDSEKIQFHLGDGLRRLGHELHITGNGRDGLWHAQSPDFDVVILDLMLPGLDGMSVLAQMRKAGVQTPVLILTARDQVPDRVKGLKGGADDYLVKPFAFDELVARIEALARRRFGLANATITIGGLTIDTACRQVQRDGRQIELTAREYQLLEFLALRRGRVFSRTEIEAHVCDENAEVSSNVVDAAVYTLRRKIDVPGEASVIITRRGMGYCVAAGDKPCPSDDE